MNEETIIRYSWDNLPEDTQTDWARVKAMTDEEIDAAALSDPDNPPIDMDDPEFWERAAMFYDPRGLVRLNIDPDLLDWFRSQGEDYRAQIGAILQAYMEANAHSEPASADKWKADK